MFIVVEQSALAFEFWRGFVWGAVGVCVVLMVALGGRKRR